MDPRAGMLVPREAERASYQGQFFIVVPYVRSDNQRATAQLIRQVIENGFPLRDAMP